MNEKLKEANEELSSAHDREIEEANKKFNDLNHLTEKLQKYFKELEENLVAKNIENGILKQNLQENISIEQKYEKYNKSFASIRKGKCGVRGCTGLGSTQKDSKTGKHRRYIEYFKFGSFLIFCFI